MKSRSFRRARAGVPLTQVSVMTTKYPQIKVKLVSHDSSALSIVMRCCEAGRRAGLSSQELGEFRSEALSGDYENVISTALSYSEPVVDLRCCAVGAIGNRQSFLL